MFPAKQPMRATVALWSALLLLLCGGERSARAATRTLPEELEFFEKQVRPLLAEHCYRCHSAQGEKIKGGLRLDTRAGFLQGGDGGAIFLPDRPAGSRLLKAVLYEDPDLQMPPKGKLADGEIAVLKEWLAQGAPWPEEQNPSGAPLPKSFDLEGRRRTHWAWQPILNSPLPEVRQKDWPANPVDFFILDRLERSHLSPAPPAKGRTLLRRLSFDLVGLPPQSRFGNAPDDSLSDEVWAAAVDTLLSSPHFGERWGRHWLDLVRYAETLGHEFDYANPNAWRYRDYVIRAFNEDIPYDQFLREHVAGDLLAEPRTNRVTGMNESVIGTAFYWLGQRDHSPVDIKQHQAELIDNQIDVLSKTFLGLTVACARCHDHKFDAIPTDDYYALYGILSSSRYRQAVISAPDKGRGQVAALQEVRGRFRQRLGQLWSGQAGLIKEYLLAADDLLRQPDHAEVESDALAVARNLDPVLLDAWRQSLAGTVDDENLFEPWRKIAAHGAPPCEPQPAPSPNPVSAPVPTAGPSAADILFADFGNPSRACQWDLDELAFGTGPVPPGELILSAANERGALVTEAGALHSGLLSRRLQGAARSPTFDIERRYIHILAAGREARINVPVENFTMIRDPIYGALKQVLQHDDFRWVTIDVGMWQNRRAYLELSDIAAPDPADDGHKNGFGIMGYIAVRKILFSNNAQPTAEAATDQSTHRLSSAAVTSRAELAERYERVITEAIQTWCKGDHSLAPEQARLINLLERLHLLDTAGDLELSVLLARYRQIEVGVENPVRVPAMVDGTGLEEPVFIRGNHRLPGPSARRGFLKAVAGPAQPAIARGSGRLELAERMLDPEDPFVARVIVNRVWLHLFGRGLVPTPDDFGVLGQAPSHPELLDWLAHWFRTEGRWSIKRLVRLLATSRTYRMSSKPAETRAEQLDPENKLWHRMPVRRLEGEAIRDAILSVSGRLDPMMYGAPVPIHLTEFMDGRGRPATSGPRDGAGRRSIYIEVRRNFVSPMMRTFDMPVPFTTIGRRTVSNVPAQSLILMNDPFIAGEARRWARKVLAGPAATPESRVREMYEAAFFRVPTAGEWVEALDFVEAQERAYREAAVEAQAVEQAWADLAHVLLNVKEFIFID